MKKQLLLSSLILVGTVAHAGVPVFGPRHDDTSLTLSQRVLRLEQQLANQNQGRVLGQIDEMQQVIQQLQGKVELQGNEIATLEKQQKDF